MVQKLIHFQLKTSSGPLWKREMYRNYKKLSNAREDRKVETWTWKK